MKKSVDHRWTKWAEEMIEAGIITDDICVLASLTFPQNQFEMEELTNKIFNELSIETTNFWTITTNYIESIRKSLQNNKQVNLAETMDLLSKLCIFSDYHNKLKSFYLLRDDWLRVESAYSRGETDWSGYKPEDFPELSKKLLMNWS
ncbi:MAG: hypothetical protein JNM93_01695 [Bacteriovoracaceae bacterium]|nr:hypothetical protein [Bacteriovoracaceae bacterium]